jgi:hypothetical protein
VIVDLLFILFILQVSEPELHDLGDTVNPFSTPDHDPNYSYDSDVEIELSDTDEFFFEDVGNEMNCKCVNTRSLLNEFPTPYHHLGWGKTEVDLMQKFEDICKMTQASGKVKFVRLHFVKRKENLCLPFNKSNVYRPSPIELITVMFKKNACLSHPFVILAIIRRKRST